MLAKNKKGFILSEAVVALGLVSISLILIHSCVQNERKTEMRLNKQVTISRKLLDGSRRLKANKSQSVSLPDSKFIFTKSSITLSDQNQGVLRKIEIE